MVLAERPGTLQTMIEGFPVYPCTPDGLGCIVTTRRTRTQFSEVRVVHDTSRSDRSTPRSYPIPYVGTADGVTAGAPPPGFPGFRGGNAGRVQ